MSGGGRLAAAARAAAPALALAAGVAAVLAPTLRADFLFNDDYGQLVGPPTWEWLLSLGRPLQWPVVAAGHALVEAGPAHVLTLRLVLLAGWLGLALAIWAAVRGPLGSWGGAALVLFAFSTPAFLISFAWLSVAANVLGYLAAAGAYGAGHVALARARAPAARALLGLLAVLLSAAAFLTYQVAPVLAVALAVFDLLHGDRALRRPRDAARLYALLAAGIALAAFSVRLALNASHVAQSPRVQELAQRLGSWRGVLLPLRMFDANAALHYYYWGWLTREGAILLGVALTILVLRTAWREVRAGSAPPHPGPLPRGAGERERRSDAGRQLPPSTLDTVALPRGAGASDSTPGLRWLLVGVGFLGGALLFSIDASRELRSKPFLSLLALFVVLHALRRTRAWAALRWKGAAVAAVALLTAWSGRRALAAGLVDSAVEELAFVEAALARAELPPARPIHLVQPGNACFAPPCYGHFEFGTKLASREEWVVPGMVRLALARQGRDPRAHPITFSRDLPGDPAAAVVDLRLLEARLRAERGEYVDLDGWLKRRRRGPVRVLGVSGLWLHLAAD